MQKVVVCGSCGMKLGIPDVDSSQPIQCPGCSTIFTLDMPSPRKDSVSKSSKRRRRGEEDDEDETREDADSPRDSNILVWGFITVVVFVVIAVGFLIRSQLKQETQTDEPKIALPFKKPFQEPKPSTPDPAQGVTQPVAQPDPKGNVPNSPQELKPYVGTPSDPSVPNKEEPKAQPGNNDKGTVPKGTVPVAVPANWLEVASATGRFHVRMPGQPIVKPFDQAKADRSGVEYMVKHPKKNFAFWATYSLLSGKAARAPAAEDYDATVARPFGDTLFGTNKDAEISHDGLKGREFSAAGLDMKKVVGRYFRREEGGKVFVNSFMVVGPDAGLDEPEVVAFLHSIKFDKGPPLPGTDVVAKSEPRPDPLKNVPAPETTPATPPATAPKPLDPFAVPPEKPTPRPPDPATKPPFDPFAPVTPKTDPKPADPGLGTGSMGGEVAKIAGKLDAHQGAVIDVNAKAALLFLPGGQAKLYAYPEFKLLASYRLGAGAASYPVYDPAGGRLFTLVPNLKKDPAGKRGGSQLAIYEIRPLLEGKITPKSVFAPTKTLHLSGFCSNLCLSPDGQALYALEARDGKGTRAVRLGVAKGDTVASAPVPDLTDGLSLTRDGKTLFALAHVNPRLATKTLPPQGTLLALDPETMKVRKTVTIAIDPFEMAVTNEGIVFVAAYGGVRGEIAVVDINADPPIVATWKGVPPSSCLKLSDNAKYLYISNWKSSPATVAGVPLPDVLAGSELPKSSWAQSPPVQARGDMVLTADSQFLVCDSGVVFLLEIR